MGPIQGQGGRETEGTAHFALPQQGRDALHRRYHHRGHRPWKKHSP